MCCLIYKFLLILTQKMQISFLKILPENALKFVSKKMRICVKNFAQLHLLSACADNNLGTDRERESVIPEQNQKEDTNLYKNELMEKTTL